MDASATPRTRLTLRDLVARASALLALSVGMGCSQHPEPTGCPADLPASCPAKVPSWANDVQPIIDRRCNPCHGGGGIAPPTFNFATYQGVSNNSGSILTQVYACRMPPPDAGAPTLAEREALLGWLVCGAPNN